MGFDAVEAGRGAAPQEPLRQLESDRQPVTAAATSKAARISRDFLIIGTSFVLVPHRAVLAQEPPPVAPTSVAEVVIDPPGVVSV